MSKSLFLQLNIMLVQNSWRINNFFSSGKHILNFLNFTHREKLLFLFSLSYFSFSTNKQLLENKKEKLILGQNSHSGPAQLCPFTRECVRCADPCHNLGLGWQSSPARSPAWVESGPLKPHRRISFDGRA